MLEVIPSDGAGEIDLKALESMLTAGGVKAVAITHVPSNGGVVNPAQEGRATICCMPYAVSPVDTLRDYELHLSFIQIHLSLWRFPLGEMSPQGL